jgi:predicted transcriptional regulator
MNAKPLDLMDIRTERTRLGLDVETLALHSGVPVAQLRKIEKGWDWCDDPTRRALEAALVLCPGALGSQADG